MADRGICSRREAEQLIEQGMVQVNGKVISKLGVRIDPNQEIKLSPLAIRKRQALVTILLNKPPGYVSTQPEKNYLDAATLIRKRNLYHPRGEIHRHPPDPASLHVAGRLDIDSSGLLVLTQDGSVARRLIHPNHVLEKEYIVRVRGNITDQSLGFLSEGLELDGRKLKRAKVCRQTDGQLQLILMEGRKRQIRRMCEQVGLEVVSLVRVRIGNIQLGRLPRGKWRFLGPNETF
jgi:23S rRNA pseudouridine2604 synthase